jgi:serine/threonine protein kinase
LAQGTRDFVRLFEFGRNALSQPPLTRVKLDAQTLRLACAWFDELVDLDQSEQAQAIARLAQTQSADAIAQLQRMLAADSNTKDFEQAAQQARDTCIIDWAEEDKIAPSCTGQIGGWQLDSELGRGGMGVVYLAHKIVSNVLPRQNKFMPEFQLQGALKLMRDSHVASVLHERFLREQRALSRLTHEGIARLFDVGNSDRGPYLVMEYIQGEPLLPASYALELRARLALFLQICDAVSFAHQRLIVHRDIKPSNVMVVNSSQIKLMDFGIAKLLDDSAGERTQFAPLTPMYSAPEQRLGEATDVRTDVYGLGLVLFEMLCASTALRFTDATASSVSADFEKPSQRVRQMPNASAIASEALQGELDTIVMTATDSDPIKRYQSVEAFAEDLRRWLGGMPIRAQPTSRWQRLRKFVSRNRLAVASAASFTFALLLISSYALWQADRAERARLRAERSAQVSYDVRQHFVGMLTRAVEQRQALAPAQLLDLADDLKYAQSKQNALAPDSRRALLLTLFPVAGMRLDYPRMQRYVQELVPLMQGASAEETKQFETYRAMLSQHGAGQSNSAQADALVAPERAAEAVVKPKRAAPGSASTQSIMMVAKAVAAIRSGDLINAQSYAQQAQALSANERDPMFQLAVRTVLVQVQSKIGEPKSAILIAQEVLTGYQQQGQSAGAPLVRKTQEALLESYLLIGDLEHAQAILNALEKSLDASVPEDQLLLGVYQIAFALMQRQVLRDDLTAPLASVCEKEAGALCARAHLWLALNAIALKQKAQALAHLQQASVAHPTESALVQAVLLSGDPTQIDDRLKRFVGVEAYGALRLLWVLQGLAHQSGEASVATALNLEAQRRAKELDLRADGIFAQIVSPSKP